MPYPSEIKSENWKHRDTIIKAAKRRSTLALFNALKHCDIDVGASDPTISDSACSFLAWENNIDAVDFLINFGAAREPAIINAAMNGHAKLVDHLIEKSPYRNNPKWYQPIINAVTRAASVGGHFNLAYKYIKLGANKKEVIQGAACCEELPDSSGFTKLLDLFKDDALKSQLVTAIKNSDDACKELKSLLHETLESKSNAQNSRKVSNKTAAISKKLTKIFKQPRPITPIKPSCTKPQLPLSKPQPPLSKINLFQIQTAQKQVVTKTEEKADSCSLM